MVVYIVTSWSPDDGRDIIRVFSDKAEAREYISEQYRLDEEREDTAWSYSIVTKEVK